MQMDAVESGEEPVIVSQPDNDIDREALEKELLATEEDIQTLNETLNVKLKRRLEIKKQLGHVDLSTISYDVKEEIARIGDSEAFRKTTRAFGQARSKTIDVAEDVKEKVTATIQTFKIEANAPILGVEGEEKEEEKEKKKKKKKEEEEEAATELSIRPVGQKGRIVMMKMWTASMLLIRAAEPPYEGPFRVLSRNAKTCRILRGDKEDVVSVDRVKAAVAEGSPDLRQGQDFADPLPPCSFTFPTLSSIIPTLSIYHTFPHHPDPNSSNAADIRTTRSGRRVHFPDRFTTQDF
ncbi:unnamed protein product [Schistocephalus solidus]|uniref:Reverse transcriptase domain-containing protein n=1 Tax=Schistocephalus solidus TaxID=70667 RepID=A0A183SHH5_SCHSO|nr:unnamed protein product [Schistocephalus solidus]